MVVGEENEGNDGHGGDGGDGPGAGYIYQGLPMCPGWICVWVNGIASPLMIHRLQPMAWFKNAVADMLNMPVWELRFLYGNRLINNQETPYDLNIQDNDFILVIRIVPLHQQIQQASIAD